VRLIDQIRREVAAWCGLPPPGASVDAAAFAEAEYPVFCMHCGYELRGLPEARCPECGREFDRGQLLVEQYVRLKRPRTDRRFQLARWLYRAGFVLILAPHVGFMALVLLMQAHEEWFLRVLPSSVDWVLPAGQTWIALLVAGNLCVLACAALAFTYTPPRAKCKAVRNALPRRRRRGAV
jgi:hypothetical protein